ncbi:hypothetical protein [Nonomuraea roseola]|uniref:hypothetical protein n=1 Tax=Nonomuraea roseola TaxID=46179 RepID=UPI0031FA0430
MGGEKKRKKKADKARGEGVKKKKKGRKKKGKGKKKKKQSKKKGGGKKEIGKRGGEKRRGKEAQARSGRSQKRLVGAHADTLAGLGRGLVSGLGMRTIAARILARGVDDAVDERLDPS